MLKVGVIDVTGTFDDAGNSPIENPEISGHAVEENSAFPVHFSWRQGDVCSGGSVIRVVCGTGQGQSGGCSGWWMGQPQESKRTPCWGQIGV